MSLELPPQAHDIFDKAGQYALEDSKFSAYGLESVTKDHVKEVCDRATESYARKELHWPRSRIAKPTILVQVGDGGPFKDLGSCIEDFVKRLRRMFGSSPPKQLPTYPLGFVAFSSGSARDKATIVLAHHADDVWLLDYCLVSVDVQLASSLDSLRMGNVTADDILNRYGGQ